MLSHLDTVSPCLDTITVGPFSIFHSQSAEIDADHSEEFLSNLRFTVNSRSVEEENIHSALSGLWSSNEDDILIDEAAFPQETSASIINPMLDDALTGNNNITLDQIQQESKYWERSTSLVIAGLNHTCETPANKIHFCLTRSPSPQMDIRGSLFPDTNISMLMYHYTKHVAELLQPVLHPGNPWRTTYFQFALQGCPDFAFNESPGPAFKVSTAIFHSVLSSAAFHLRNVTGGSAKFHKLGLRHRAKSLQALNSAILDPWDSKLYTAYLTAMLSLVTIDVGISAYRTVMHTVCLTD